MNYNGHVYYRYLDYLQADMTRTACFTWVHTALEV